MEKHVKIYLDFFDIGEQDTILCEVCGKIATGGIHHIKFHYTGDNDDIANLIALCYECYQKANGIGTKNFKANTFSPYRLSEIHKKKLKHENIEP